MYHSEKELFLDVYQATGGVCQITGIYIPEPQAWCFAHILGKGMHPEFRYEPRNIIFVANEEIHRKVDAAVAGHKHFMSEILRNGMSLVPLVQQLVRSEYPQLKKSRS